MILGLVGCSTQPKELTNEEVLLSGNWTDGTYTLTFRDNGTAHFEGGENPNDVKWSLKDNLITLEWMGMINVYSLEKENGTYTLISPDNTIFNLVTETTNRIEEQTQYNIGDTVSTDCLECVLLSVEENNGYIEVAYSVKNIGKESLSSAWIRTNKSVTRSLAGLSILDYNNGYIYDEQVLNTVDNETLLDIQPLEDEITVTDVYDVPEEVWNNADAPLLVTICLYSNEINENAEYDKSLPEITNDAAKHTFRFTYKVR